MRRSTSRVLTIFGLFAFLGAAASMAWIELTGFGDLAMVDALIWSARAGLLIYLVVFVARPLHQLLRRPWTAKLAANRRYVGVAFAAVMTVHLVLLIKRNGFAFNVPGSGAYAMIYLMLLTSFDRSAAWLGPRYWRILHKTGLYWVGVIFAFVIASSLYVQPGNTTYWLLAGLLAAAVGVRIAAFASRRDQPTATAA